MEGQNFMESIFLSNTGGRDITKETLKFWTEGKKSLINVYIPFLPL